MARAAEGLKVPTKEGDAAAVSKADTVRAPGVARTSSRERRGMETPLTVAQGRVRLDKKIGEGSFGMVFLGYDTKTEKQVAVKLEHKRSSGSGQLANESRLMENLSRPHRPDGFAECVHFGKEGSYSVLVMELLGHTLEDTVMMCHGKMNSQTVAVVAEQSIRLLAYVHSKAIVHRDIKSENFMWGLGNKPHHLYIIDFGMSTRYYMKAHNRMHSGRQLTGTARYASINAMKGLTQSRRDDLEALAHVMTYALRGSLPWSGLDAPTYKDKLKLISETKEKFPLDDLCRGFPEEFQGFLSYTRNMAFDEKPDYDQWIGAFQTLRLEKLEGSPQAWELQFLGDQEIDVDGLAPLSDEPAAPQPEETMMDAATSVRTSGTGEPAKAAE